MQTYTNPKFPGKVFRRLEVGDLIQEGDYASAFEGGEMYKLSQRFFGRTPIRFCYRELPGHRPLEEGETFAPSETPLTTDQKIDAILAKLERIDAVLEKL